MTGPREWWERPGPAVLVWLALMALAGVALAWTFADVRYAPAAFAAVVGGLAAAGNARQALAHRVDVRPPPARRHVHVVHPAYDWTTEDDTP